MATANKIEIRWAHSTIGCPPDQEGTIRGLGLKRLHQTRKLIDSPAVRGMLEKVSHLVDIVEAGPKKKADVKKAAMPKRTQKEEKTGIKL